MSDGLPTDEQLQRMERTVMARIRRRAELPKRIATGAAVAALFAGGVFLVPRLGFSASTSGGSTAQYGESDSSGRSAAGGSSSLLAGCHASPDPTSGTLTVPVTADTATAAIDACLLALQKGQVPGSKGTSDLKDESFSAKDLVACRDDAGTLQVFVTDAHPSTLCTRNGLKAP